MSAKLKIATFLITEPEYCKFLFDKFREAKVFRDRIDDDTLDIKTRTKARYSVINILNEADGLRYRNGRSTNPPDKRAPYRLNIELLEGYNPSITTKALFDEWYKLQAHKGGVSEDD